MPVPKRRQSKAKSRSRRANHMKMTPPNPSWCDHCGSPKMPHRVCLSCGWYNGRQVIRVVVD
jgi:large subunit ribosomal protein L32